MAKIYPAHIEGRFRQWKNVISVVLQAVLFVTPWLNWNGRPILLVDLAGRKLHLFGMTFWPQETHFLLLLLLAAGLSLFLVSSLLGRVWCGFACPHTLLTHAFIMVERFIEGPADQRRRLDRRDWTDKAPKKVLKYSVWLGMSVFLGLTFSGYFAPIRQVARGLLDGTASTFSLGLIAFFTLVSMLFFGLIRSNFCTTICPYARFQSALTNAETLMVNYDLNRGEPRGKVKDPKAADCIDCSACVRVCPMGIDIRDGFQFACINCASCIDACDDIMDKVGRPRGLVRFASLGELEEEAEPGCAEAVLNRPWSERMKAYGVRPLVYSMLLGLVLTYTMVLAWQRPPFDFEVVRESAGPGVTFSFDGRNTNRFTLRVVNRTGESRWVDLRLLDSDERFELVTPENPAFLEPESVRPIQVLVMSPARSKTEVEKITFELSSQAPQRATRQRTSTYVYRGGKSNEDL